MANRIKFSLTISNRGPLVYGASVSDLLSLAEVADQSEVFDAVMVGDSLLTKPRLESVTTLSAIAARTHRVRLGVACLSSFPLRNPILLADQWATLDQISDGRTIMVACIGGSSGRIKGEEEFRAFDRSINDRVSLLREGVEILRRLWSEDSVTYHGKFNHLEGVHLEPKPIQKSPPIWIAVRPPSADAAGATYRRLAKLSDGWMSIRLRPEEVQGGWQEIQRYCHELRRDVPVCAVYANLCLDDSRERALRESKEYLDKYYYADFSWEIIESWGAYGSRADCIRVIEGYRDAGVNFITFRPTGPNVQDQVRRWVRDLLPSF